MTEFVEVKVSELEGEALDWAVAQADGFPVEYGSRSGVTCQRTMSVSSDIRYVRAGSRYRPSTDWSQLGPLIEKFGIAVALENEVEGLWGAAYKESHDESAWVFRNASWQISDAPTALIAACRAIVAAKLGDTVSVPKELMP